MVQEVLGGGKVTVNDEETYDNGIKVVPTQLLQPVSVDKANIVEVLSKAEYYTEAEMKG